MTVLQRLARIVQSAAEADSPAVQVRHIVDGIHREMGVDVCSLFLTNDRDELALVASHGLGDAAVGRAALPHGVGLVGLVATSRHPVNLVDPAEHPAFHYVPGSKEERFRSFCAVPLERWGEVLGVLTVQRLAPVQLTKEEQAFLVTLGAQLALVVSNWKDWQATDSSRSRVISGVRGARGVGQGLIHLCEDVDLFAVPDGASTDRQREIDVWRELLAQVRADVAREQALLDVALSDEVRGIFDAYLMLLADPTLSTGVEQRIRGGQDLPSALRSVVQGVSDVFLEMDDPYLRARHEDIRHLGNRLYASWRKTDGHPVDLESEDPIVLVGAQVTVSDIARVPRDRLAGVACFQGSAFSHTAVLCNALGVPAVLGLGELRGLREGDMAIVDGHGGQLIVNPDPGVVQEYQTLSVTESAFAGELARLREQPATTLDGLRINLLANSGLTADLSPGVAAGAEGLGLYRTEIPFMVSETFPSEEEQLNLYRTVLEAYGDKPVTMRILDIGADKPLPYFPIAEENPVLGWRGIRFCLDNTSLLVTQLRAMLRAAEGRDNLQVLVPMVSAAWELREFHQVLDIVVAQLREENLAAKRPAVGIMVEVPAAISQLGKWRDWIDFISIGSNDLSQYLLAVDRNNPRVAESYDHLHPAVLVEIERVVRLAAELGLPVSLCGEMASDPNAVLLLVGLGIPTLSMSAAQLPRVKWLIRALRAADMRALCASAMQLDEAAEVRQLTTDYLISLNYPGISGPAKATP
jgi:phosphotransferase system enzyme I (PtsI)/phosphotransferase system enzyme I (PtsP)